MEQNHIASDASARAGFGEPAPYSRLPAIDEASMPAADPPEDEHAFGSEAEADAYWAGVADGIRQLGGTVPPRLAARAAQGNLLVAVHDESPPGDGDDVLAFDPAPVRHRVDGWTPQRQREFVEALADTGVVRAACARVGMSETSLNALRRRASARTFDAACTVALRRGARRLVSIGYERAIEGTIKRHYFHGELKAEERVYDNRQLFALINRLPPDDAPNDKAAAIEANWEPWMEAIEAGRDKPSHPPLLEDGTIGDEIKFENGEVFTSYPPPVDYDGVEEGFWGVSGYRRTLSSRELENVDIVLCENLNEYMVKAAAARDRLFGFEGGHVPIPIADIIPSAKPSSPDTEAEVSAKGSATSETSAAVGEPEAGGSGADRHSGERPLIPAAALPSGEADRGHGIAEAPDTARPDEARAAGS